MKIWNYLNENPANFPRKFMECPERPLKTLFFFTEKNNKIKILPVLCF